jgi:hypothetical protein
MTTERMPNDLDKRANKVLALAERWAARADLTPDDCMEVIVRLAMLIVEMREEYRRRPL